MRDAAVDEEPNSHGKQVVSEGGFTGEDGVNDDRQDLDLATTMASLQLRLV